jgi:uncharacterized protein (TIRG00374 family)
MSTDKSHARARWHAALAIVLTLGLLALFFRGNDLPSVLEKLRRAHVSLLVLALACTALTYVFRAWRWQALLAPLGGARFRTAFRTTVIGFTASNLLPLRPGEVLRPYLLARQEKLSAPSAFATIIIERLLDMVTVLLFFCVFLWTTDAPPGSAAEGRLHSVKLGGALLSAIATGVLITLFACAGHPERLGRWAGRMSRALPESVGRLAARLVQMFAEGLAVMRHPRPLVLAFALSVPLWLSIGCGIWLTSRAFDLTLPFTGAFLIMMFLVGGVAVPTPSGIGGFHEAYKIAVMMYFGAAEGTAVAAAIVLHAVSFLPVTLLGLAFIAQEGLTLAGLQRMRATAAAAEHVE